MGSQIIATCRCGLTATSFIGGTMADFQTVQRFPAVCNACNKVVQVNAISESPQCLECGSADVTLYNDESLIGNPGGEWPIAQSLNLKIYNGTYKCPSCGKFLLQFKSSGLMFD